MVFWYRNSFLASVVSVLASACGIIAILGLFKGEVPVPGAIVLILLCIGGLLLASRISENKVFKKWRRQVEEKGLDANIRASVADAVALYNTCPQSRTLDYIRSLNPAAADQIAQSIRTKKEKK